MEIKEWPGDPRLRTYTEEEEELYRQIASRLKRRGPESEWLPRIYKFVATPEQVKVLLELPATAEEIAQKLGVDKKFVEDTIQDQFEKGVIIYTRRGAWHNMHAIYQFHDATLPTRRYEHEDWWKDYEDAWGALYTTELDDRQMLRVRDMEVPRVRVLCDHRVLKTLPPEDVTEFDNLEDILKAIPPVAYEPCSCRRKVRDRECHSPENTCILNSRTAEYNIRRGSAWEVSVEEALEVQDKGMDWGLVSTVMNSRRVTGVVCVCHPCVCCAYFRIAAKYSLPPQNFVKPSRYRPEVDPSMCDSCQICVDTCPFGAIKMIRYPKDNHLRHPLGSPRYKSWVDPEICMGCGNCVLKCPNGAIMMKVVHPLDWIPEEEWAVV